MPINLKIAFLVFILITYGCSKKAITTQQKPYNFIVIVTDDQRYDQIQYMPNLMDEINQRGVLFEKAFVTTPLCCPSRASILTGKKAINTEVIRNRPPLAGIDNFDDKETIGVWLQKKGYKTALIGKYLNGYHLKPTYIPIGWNYWAAFNGKSGYSNAQFNVNGINETKNYGTTAVFDYAQGFINQNKQSPFLLYLAPFAPHKPFEPEIEDEYKFIDISFADTPSLNELDVSDKISVFRNNPLIDSTTLETYKLQRIEQLQCLQSVDRGIKKTIDLLKRQGLYDRTVILFISDNGYLWGEHRLTSKILPYEESLKVPMAVSAPFVKQHSMDTTNMVLNTDIAPTLLALANTQAPENWQFDGANLTELLKSQKPLSRDFFTFEMINEFYDKDTVTTSRVIQTCWGVRTTTYKLIQFISGEREFYDLQNDPYELQNEINTPKYAQIINELATHLLPIENKIKQLMDKAAAEKLTNPEKYELYKKFKSE